MKKAAFKTFVCSFVFSLFLIFSVNGVFLHKKSLENQEINLPEKNILLFLKDEARTSPSVRPAPVKKIALSVLREPQTTAEDAAELIPINAESDVILASVSEEDMLDFPSELPTEKRLSAPTPPNRLISDNFQEVIKRPPTTEKAKGKPLLPPEPIKLAAAEASAPIYAPEAKPALESAPTLPAASPQKKNHEPQLIIPLEKSAEDVLLADKGARVAKQAPQNQVALADADIPISSMKSLETPAQMPADAAETAPAAEWESMAEKSGRNDNPWLVAKGSKHPKNAMVLQEDYAKPSTEEIKDTLSRQAKISQEEAVAMASETIDNILIPIPEDILNDKNLTPQLVSPRKGTDAEYIRRMKEGQQEEKDVPLLRPIAEAAPLPAPEPVEEEKTKATVLQTEEKEATNSKKDLISSISSLFSEDKTADEAQNKKSVKEQAADFWRVKKKTEHPKRHTKILPVEIRLSFQPNRAEISGQTLRWIQAFANKIKEDASTGIEVRIDGTSAMELQQKRLNLLHNILTSRGVDYSKINTVFTNREPNSFIIRTIKLNNNQEMTAGNNRQVYQGGYMQW